MDTDAPAPGSPSSPIGGQVVPGNRWDELAVPALGAWEPTRTVSVVLPHYQAPEALHRTLASLAAQTYPRHLVELVVVDDGSEPPLELGEVIDGLTVTVLHQPDRGFGLARARDTGARAASGEVVVFLDCDMLAEPRHLEAHARWHHACDHAVTLGSRQHVEVGGLTPGQVLAAGRDGALAPLFAGTEPTTPAWLERHLERTDQLRADHDDLFRVTAGGNLGLRRQRYLDVGGFDVRFDQWGSEDTDLGHRLFLAGEVFVPEPEAACWHQGDSRGLEPHERRSLAEQRARISQTIPHPHFRRMRPGRSFAIPAVVVHVDARGAAHAPTVATVEDLLANDVHDLEVVLDLDAGDADRVLLERELAGDPRVRTAPRPEHARTPLRLDLAAGVRLEPDAIRGVLAAIGTQRISAGLLTIGVPGAPGDRVEAWVTRATARARAAGAASPDEVRAATIRWFGHRHVEGSELGMRWEPCGTLDKLRVIAPPPGGTDAPARNTAVSRVAAWQLLDGPTGWRRRTALAAGIQAALTEAEVAASQARHEAEVARAETARLKARRAVRVTTELSATRRDHSVGSLPRRLRDAARARDLPSVPATPDATGDDPARRARRRADELVQQVQDAAGAERIDDLERDRLPELRVLHLGVLRRFGGLVDHETLQPDTWKDQLAHGADLLLLEPPPRSHGWDPLGALGPVLRAAEELGLPSVRIHVDEVDVSAPGRATLELVEGHDADLAPSIDHTAFHPRGWTAAPPDAVSVLLARAPDPQGNALLAALDPQPVVLYPSDLARSAPAVPYATEVAQPERLGAMLRRSGVLLDAPWWRLSERDRTRSWLAALACGTPVVAVTDAADDPGAERCGGQVPGVLRVPGDQAVEAVHGLLIDPELRERHGIVGRRHALTEGSRRAALLRILDHLGVARPADPRITVLLSTHRPELVERALDQIARQRDVDVEVSLVLHGAGFDDHDLPRHEGVRLAHVTRAPGAWRLGECLNAALDHAGGELVAKMDDDDHYGPFHLADLQLAWRHSGADVVGKRIEYVHVVERGLTIRRHPSRPERDRPHVGGPTLFASRDTLRRFRFLHVPNRVDSTLYERVRAAGGRIYGTHSRDVVLARHGSGHQHAWDVEEDALLDEAVLQRPGLDIDLASSDPARWHG